MRHVEALLVGHTTEKNKKGGSELVVVVVGFLTSFSYVSIVSGNSNRLL